MKTINTSFYRPLYYIFILTFVSFFHLSYSQPVLTSQVLKTADEDLIHPKLVNKFYQQNPHVLFWFSTDKNSVEKRRELLLLIEKGNYLGLDKDNYHFNELQNSFNKGDSLDLITVDKLYTDAALSYSKDLYSGSLGNWLSYDVISEKCSERDDDFLINNLLNIKSTEDLNHFFNNLEPNEKEYQMLKKELLVKIQQNDSTQNGLIQIKKLTSSLNFFRWIHHFRFDKFIVINIASTTLRYYERDSIVLKMKVVAGKPSTKTPRFAAYCNEVVLYPYWNVPYSIAVNELLPLFKFRPLLLEGMNMQVLDRMGNVLNPDSIKWSTLTKQNFPYKFRQSTGCDNALGVMKFNLTSPFSVYMHDTNLKAAFQSDNHYLSHGCIRLEKPVELGNYLLHNKLDTAYLALCLKNQEPISLPLDKAVPVFVVYITVEADETDTVKYHKDVYSLLK